MLISTTFSRFFSPTYVIIVDRVREAFYSRLLLRLVVDSCHLHGNRRKMTALTIAANTSVGSGFRDLSITLPFSTLKTGLETISLLLYTPNWRCYGLMVQPYGRWRLPICEMWVRKKGRRAEICKPNSLHIVSIQIYLSQCIRGSAT